MKPHPPIASLASFVFLALSMQGVNGQLTATQKTDIGFTALQEKLGMAMPTGAGISVTQVEAMEDKDGTGPLPPAEYRPDPAVFPGKNFIYGSGGSAGFSNHATNVGRYFYGGSSLAPGIGVSPESITVYEANGFLQNDFLRTFNSGALPNVETSDVQNHSWIGNFATASDNLEATRRMDFAIQRDDFVATFGLNNGSGTTVPSLMAGAFNGITVGRSDGLHSRGGIALDGGLRTRPDIVVPTTATSWAAPTVGGAAALLIETARGTTGLENADRSVVVKSLLFTGATRDEAEFGGAWSNSSSQPLDAVYGSGELNVLHSHDILVAGENNAGLISTVAARGWDLGVSSDTIEHMYFFDLTEANSHFQVAASLVWNRNVTATDNQAGPGFNYSFASSLANLDLRLFRASGFDLGSEIGSSLSTVDNVELLIAGGLAAGRYAWQVSSDTTGIDYGFSWNVESITPIPEPSVLTLAVVGMLCLFRRRR